MSIFSKYAHPNRSGAGAIDSSDQFEHVFDPYYILEVFEKISGSRFWLSVLKNEQKYAFLLFLKLL